MVRDGIYYGLAFVAVAVLVGWLTIPALGIVPLLLAAFFLWFFRDPERQIPAFEGAIVSPADGKVTDISVIEVDGEPRTRISIFLNVFNVHVNRSPVSRRHHRRALSEGQVRQCHGRGFGRGRTSRTSSPCRPMHGTMVFKQIAGLLARRIVFTKKVGDRVARGERVGLIKFGSRTDVIFAADARDEGAGGRHVKGGSTVLAIAQPRASMQPRREMAEVR